MIARRKKFQSSGPVQASESKVISLKSKRKQASPSAHDANDDDFEDRKEMFNDEEETEKRFDDKEEEEEVDEENHDLRHKVKNADREDKKSKGASGGVTDLRVQLHRKRMQRGESPKERSPPSHAHTRQPKQARTSRPTYDDPRDRDERDEAVGRMAARAGLVIGSSAAAAASRSSPPETTSRSRRGRESRYIVEKHVTSRSPSPPLVSDPEHDELPIIKKGKRTTAFSRLGEPVHAPAAAVKRSVSPPAAAAAGRVHAPQHRGASDEDNNAGDSADSDLGDDHTPETSPSKKSKKNKKDKKLKKDKKDSREKKLEKKLKKLKEQLNTALRDEADRPDKIDKLLSSLPPELTAPTPQLPAPAKPAKKSSKRSSSETGKKSAKKHKASEAVKEPTSADAESEEALFAFFE